jgi:hypothetical protein
MRTDLAAIAFHEPYQPPRLRRTGHPTAELLRKFAGRYEVGPGFVLTVRADSDRLALAGPEGDYLPLDPQSDAEFFFRALYVPVAFERDSTGSVVDLKWGDQFKCKRIN